MTCSRCPYTLLCWSTSVGRFTCPNCHRTILDTNPLGELHETSVVVVVKHCKKDMSLVWNNDERYAGGTPYSACPICDPPSAKYFDKWLEREEEWSGWRYMARKKEKEGDEV